MAESFLIALAVIFLVAAIGKHSAKAAYDSGLKRLKSNFREF